jgi:hypothetical protein
MAPPPNCFLCFSRAITYVKKQRKLLGSGAITDGETDAKNASVDCPLPTLHALTAWKRLIFVTCKMLNCKRVDVQRRTSTKVYVAEQEMTDEPSQTEVRDETNILFGMDG